MAPARQNPLPVLIIGNGPVGLILAYALCKMDVPVIVITRHMRRLGVPKAHALSPRSLEICRQLTIPVTEIRMLPAHRTDARWVRFCTNLSGQQLGTLPYEHMTLDILNHSPEMLHNIAQPDLEALIEHRLMSEPNCDYRKGWTWISHKEVTKNGETMCVSTVEDTYTGEEMTIESSVIVGADGANSRVRKFLGIQSEGEETADTMMTIHFNADLRPIVGDNVGMIQWIFDPAARGFIVSYDISYNHVLIHNIDPVRDPISSFSPDKCMEIVKAALGADVPVDFQCSMPWILRRKVCNQFYKGRVVLAGDAAHSFPPTGGLGLNSGVGDAHNLAYKLAGWYHGWADLGEMFHQYETERRPVALRNSHQSVRNGKKIFSLLKALKNTHPDPVIARREMNQALSDPKHLAYIQALIADQREHFDNLGLHIGYVYEPGWNPPNSYDFSPAYRRGGRLAHTWIRPKTADVINNHNGVDLRYLAGDLPPDKMRQWSYTTLDMIPIGSYVLIHPGGLWTRKAMQMHQLFAQSRIPLRAIEIGRDFELVERVQGKKWLEGYGFPKGNAILVRPDQHLQAVIPPSQTTHAALESLLEDLGMV